VGFGLVFFAQRDIFTPLFLGACCVIPTEGDIVEPGMLARFILHERITVSCFTPAMCQLLTSDPESPPIPDYRLVFFVGDMLQKQDVERVCKLCPALQVINMYGSTETQRSVSYFPCPPASHPSFALLKDILPCGVGMQGVDLIVLNSMGLLAGIGEIGEIHMRSPQLAKGYLDLETATKDKFIQNPFNPTVPADRLYRTGTNA
jgi:L-aminoadipate-semialdehyde dehydrogenase